MKLLVKAKGLISMLLILVIISSCGQESSDSETEVFISQTKDSIEAVDITGEWRLSTPNTYRRLILGKNNIWKMEFEDYNNDTLIKKGKYVIAKDSAVFFRYFGSQHWPNTDTINDYKTSLGAFVLFLNEENELKDNQEDYEQSYLKVK